MARAALPCESCGAGGEPVIRRPRPYSSGESAKAGAFFACPECGHRLSELRGAAADRLSDVPEDNLPDPAGMLARRIQPLVGEARPGDRAKVLAQAVTGLPGNTGSVAAPTGNSFSSGGASPGWSSASKVTGW